MYMYLYVYVYVEKKIIAIVLSTSKIREHSCCSLRDYIGVANIDILVGSGGLFQLWDGIARRTHCYPFKFKPIYPYIRFSF